MAPAVYVLSRADSDFGTNVFSEIAAIRSYEPGACVEVDHDAETHQLRVLGRHSIETLSAAGTRGHYEVLLRSNAYNPQRTRSRLTS